MKEEEKKTVLIAGGSGLIGQAVQKELHKYGHEVRVLTREIEPSAPYFYWDPKLKDIDLEALKGVDVIINLAGAGIADRLWTKKRKRELLNSRVKPNQFLHEMCDDIPTLKQFISASGINCYGYEKPTKIYKETDLFGHDFLSTLVRRWEEAVDLFAPDRKVAKIRTGIVLTEKGGALPKISIPIKYYVGSALGNGEQRMPWITLSDIARLYVHAVHKELDGVYNAASGSISNASLTHKIAKKLNKPLWLPSIPSFLLRTVLGEMASLLLDGIRVDNGKILKTGFTLKQKTIDEALYTIYGDEDTDTKQ